MKIKYLSLFLILATTFLASAVGGYVTSVYKEPWYSQLVLSPLSPPAWVFGPVWTTLYILMSIAVWRVWQFSFDRKILFIYYIHLFFNACWSVIFFGLHNILLALINLSLILFFIIFLMYLYKSIDKLAFYLMIPYIAWSTYAFFLNFSILILN